MAAEERTDHAGMLLLFGARPWVVLRIGAEVLPKVVLRGLGEEQARERAAALDRCAGWLHGWD